MQRSVDLNCDMGESFGAYRLGADEDVMPLITSANVACGFHAGDPDVMDRTVRLAAQFGVHVGAHPGYPDLAGFGRRRLDMDREELINSILYQIGALDAFCRKHGVALRHVKPHGYLGNRVDADADVAEAVADAVTLYDNQLPIFVKPGTKIHEIAAARRMNCVLELFADRAYNDDLTLVPRQWPGAVITDPRQAAERVVSMIKFGKVTTYRHREAEIRGETICVHGDTPNAVEMIREIRSALAREGYTVAPHRRIAAGESEQPRGVAK